MQLSLLSSILLSSVRRVSFVSAFSIGRIGTSIRLGGCTMLAGRDVSVEGEAVQILTRLKSGEIKVSDLLGPLHGERKNLNTGPSITAPRPPIGKFDFVSAPEFPALPSENESNIKLVENVHPKNYVNPVAQEKGYDLVVIGSGVSGLLSVIIGSSLGMDCALIEKHYMGGDCLNVGCVPSKALIACAHRVHLVKNSSSFGIDVPGNVGIDFSKVMERMRKIRADISINDSVKRYARDFCKDIFLGEATFEDDHTVIVDGQKIKFRKAMIATGGSPSVPTFMEDIPYLVNANFFNLEEMPSSICIIGAGPIGLELAQSMARFGCKVTSIERADQILIREDREAADLLQKSIESDGVDIVLSATVESVEVLNPNGGLYRRPFHGYRIKYTQSVNGSTTEHILETDCVLVASGRIANVENIGLENVGVEFDKRFGVVIDEEYRTTCKSGNIYATGDCASPFKFTHSADWQARCAIRNMFLGTSEKFQDLLIPWCTYTDPELAHVGLYERDLKDRGIEYFVCKRGLEHVDRCICEGVTSGFVKILVSKDSGQIMGATIVAPNAGDMISELTLAMQCSITAQQLAGTIHPYPTTQEAIRQAAAQYLATLKTPAVKRAIELAVEQHQMKENPGQWWQEVLAAAQK